MDLSELQTDFVLHFGEMGSRWGISRTVGQIYALLFLSETPLYADQIVERLGVSRSNVSIGLKELQAWELVRLQHVPGDRRDYFSTPDDVWLIARTLLEQRRKREINPTLTKLRELQMRGETATDDAHARKRIDDLAELIELVSRWGDEVERLEIAEIKRLMAAGEKLKSMLRVAGRVLPFDRSGDGTEKAG